MRNFGAYLRRTWLPWLIVVLLAVTLGVIAFHQSTTKASVTAPKASTSAPVTPISSSPVGPISPTPVVTNPTPTKTPVPVVTIPEATLADLKISIAEATGGGTAGSIYYNIEFQNTSGVVVSMFGYPGVSVVDANGNRIGDAAGNASATTEEKVVMEPNAFVHVQLRVTDAGALVPQADQATSVSVRIYPPDSTASVLLPFAVVVPTTNVVSMSVSPVIAGN